MNTTRTPSSISSVGVSRASSTTKPGAGGLTADNLRFLCKTIYNQSGIVLDESKSYLLEARLLPLARDAGEGTLDGLCNLMRATVGNRLRDKVVEALTTNETLFFRDIKPFESFEKFLVPELTQARAGTRTLRLWCAACSTGQEPYSLAMLWQEMNLAGWKLEILATDLSETVLERARSGRFQQLEVNRGLPARYLVKYFTRDGMAWEIKPHIRSMIRWDKFNLKDSVGGKGPFDVVFCRNVLIYFDVPTKRQILGNIRKVLRPGGYLALGSSETTFNVDDTYIRRQIGPSIFYQTPER